MRRVTCRGCTGEFVCIGEPSRECSDRCWRIVKKRLKRNWRMAEKRRRAMTEPLKSDRDAMFAAVLADAADDVRRLAYADLIEEGGRPEDVALAARIRRCVPCYCSGRKGPFYHDHFKCSRCDDTQWAEGCQHEQCRAPAIECTMTPIAEDQPEDVEYFCRSHAPHHGYCSVCGDFWGGIDSFERDGICDHCADQLEQDEDLDEMTGDRDEDWPDGFYA